MTASTQPRDRAGRDDRRHPLLREDDDLAKAVRHMEC